MLSVPNQSDHNLKFAVIIPALNEELSISRVIKEIPNMASKVIVVNNGSTDHTVERAREAGAHVVYEGRRGYGYACLRGMEEAGDADVIIFLDGDYSDHPGEMEILVKPSNII